MFSTSSDNAARPGGKGAGSPGKRRGGQFVESGPSPLANFQVPPPKWTRDEDAAECERCQKEFTVTTRRHHCRHCGKCVCGSCSPFSVPLPRMGMPKKVRVCIHCYRTLERGDRLFQALEKGSQAAALKLVNGGMLDVTSVNKQLHTHLLVAAQKGFEDVVRALVKSGSDVNFVAPRLGKHYFRCALCSKMLSVGRSPKMLISCPHCKGVNRLTKLPPDISGGQSALYYAIKGGFQNIVSFLLKECKCNTTVPPPFQKTPLLHAASFGNVFALQMCIDCGADVRWKDSLGKTALHYAANRGNVDACQMLVQAGAHVTAADMQGNTARDVAARARHTGVVQYIDSLDNATPTAADA